MIDHSTTHISLSHPIGTVRLSKQAFAKTTLSSSLPESRSIPVPYEQRQTRVSTDLKRNSITAQELPNPPSRRCTSQPSAHKANTPKAISSSARHPNDSASQPRTPLPDPLCPRRQYPPAYSPSHSTTSTRSAARNTRPTSLLFKPRKRSREKTDTINPPCRILDVRNLAGMRSDSLA